VDRAPVDMEAKTSEPAIVGREPAAAPVAVKTRGPRDRQVCAVPPCLRVAALSPAPRRRPAVQGATQGNATLIKVALAPNALEKDTGAPSLQDRLLQPVGNFRDRVVGLMSSL
jgi:hypothetical protein